jgi:hypothetical protein
VPPPDPDLPGVFGRAEAAAAGLSNGQISRRLDSGRWTRVRHGRFAPVGDLDERTRWSAEITAELTEHRRTLVLSHAHAARAWGWPVPLGGWGQLTFTDTSGPVRTRRVRIAVAPLHDDEVRGTRILVTSPARTVVDCARTLPARDALAIADAALASGRVTPLTLEAALRRAKGWPGSRQARRVVEVGDGRRESALESWSAWAFDERGLARPVWQVDVRDVSGVLLGRVDAWWREGVAGEADGRSKYRTRALGRGDGDGSGFERVLHEERVREMQMRRTGVQMVRWEARDVLVAARATDLVAYIGGQLVAVRGLPFNGSVHLPPRPG